MIRNAMAHRGTGAWGSGAGRRVGAVIAVVVMLAALLATAGPLPAAASTILTDCTQSGLQTAINAGGTVTFNCTPGTTTITLTSPLTVSASVTLDGSGAGPQITLSGGRHAGMNDGVRVFTVSGMTTVFTVQSLTITGGNNATGNGGGAIANSNSTVNVLNSTLSGNTDDGGTGGTNGSATGGGGILNFSGTVNVTNSTLATNAASSRGGGIYSISGAVNVTNSTFSANATKNNGGAIYAAGGTLTVTNSTFANNTSGVVGGGIDNDTTTSVTSSTFSGNATTMSGGGGAIYTNPGNGGHMTVTSSIVVGSTSGDNCGTIYGGAPPTDGGYNLEYGVGGTSATCAFSNHAVAADPMLAPLGSYGGPTQTLALLNGSAAINAAGTCTGADQRGITRPQPAGGACDIGAFESRGFALTPGGDGQSAVSGTTFAQQLTAAPVANDPNVPVSGIGPVTFTIIAGMSGAGATFGSSGTCTTTNSFTVVCNVVGGVATSPPLTANTTLGPFTVTAAATGVPTVTYTLAVRSAMALTLGPATIPATGPGAPYRQTFTASGGTGLGYTYSLATGSTLPPGLMLSSAGVLSGTSPTTGSYMFTVQVTDSSMATATRAYTLTVVQPNATPAPEATVASRGVPGALLPTHTAKPTIVGSTPLPQPVRK